MKEKLPGGEAKGKDKKDFTPAEQNAIDKGAKIERGEHGSLAPKEIAMDHIKEAGAKYYSDKEGLPAMEKKLEGMEKNNTPLPETKIAYDSNLSKQEHCARMKMHSKAAMDSAHKGNKESAIWHNQQAKQHFAAVVGKASENVDIKKGDVIDISSKKKIASDTTPVKPTQDPRVAPHIAKVRQSLQTIQNLINASKEKKIEKSKQYAPKIAEQSPVKKSDSVWTKYLQRAESLKKFDQAGVTSIQNAFGGSSSAPAAPAPAAPTPSAPAPAAPTSTSGMNQSGVNSIKNAFGG